MFASMIGLTVLLSSIPCHAPDRESVRRCQTQTMSLAAVRREAADKATTLWLRIARLRETERLRRLAGETEQ
jgi:hypothetical protein